MVRRAWLALLLAACGPSVADEATAGVDAGAAGDDGDKSDSPQGDDPPALAPVLRHGGLRVLTYNIKHAELSSLDAIAGVILAQDPDLVALEEVDVGTARSDGVDQAARLGQLIGMHQAFVPSLESFDGGQYGLALLSRYPLAAAERVLLPSAAEQRIVALFDVEIDPDHTIPVAVTHFGTTGAAEREGQADAALAALAGDPWAILAGDLNATPSETSVARLGAQLSDAWIRGGSGSGNTSSAGFPTRRIDYVLLGAAWTSPVSAAVIGASSESDHRPVLASAIAPWSQTVYGDRTPANAAEQSDTRAVELGVKVHATVDGAITSIRYYRGAAAPAGTVAHLWSASGTLLAEATAPPSPVPGWQEAILPTPITVTAGTAVIASYYAPSGRFARDTYALAADIPSGDLAALAHGGLFLYRTGGGFPTSTYKDTSYWVDVRFSPAP